MGVDAETKAKTDDNLDLLTNHTHFLIAQEIEVCKACCPWCVCGEQENEYEVITDDGEVLLECDEDSWVCLRCCCCAETRPFTMTCKRKNKENFLTFKRPWKCDICCFPRQKINIHDGQTDEKIGDVRAACSIMHKAFNVYSGDEKVYTISASTCAARCCFVCYEHLFTIYDLEEKEVGHIAKIYGGAQKEILMDADQFNIKFPNAATNRDKAVLLGAVILIDYMYFERKEDPEKAEAARKGKKK